jgi:hypothetical protein
VTSKGQAVTITTEGEGAAARLSAQFSLGVVFVTGSPEFVSQAEMGIPVVLKPVNPQSVAEALKQTAIWCDRTVASENTRHRNDCR